ncbi:MAG TPA: FHA domain-containing protein [Pyrinomonadaceae bacterium]|nr:FHA domain-containing protein [Pyrinomonadaceae bacterium]
MLKFNGVEIAPKDGVTTLGRTPDNDVSFPDDSNVSRAHAEIEARGNEFCLIDLNSSNGTTVNGTKVTGDIYLKPGDHIVLGGSSEILFDHVSEEKEAEKEGLIDEPSAADFPNIPVGDALRQAPSLASASSPSPAAGSRTMLMVAGGAVLLAVVVVGVTGAIYYRSRSSACDAKAKITKPEAGETIYAATEIEVEIDDPGCIAKAIYTVDGVEFASSEDAPFTVALDPKEHPDLADGFDHSFGVILVDDNGNRIPQAGDVLLAMETRKVGKPEDKPTGPQPQEPTGPTGPVGKEVTIIQVQEMTARLAKQLSGTRKYNVSNKQFLQEVQKKAGEYAQEGYYDRASKYRDAINVAFVREQNLEAPLGYMLAMSRSRFDPQKAGTDEGLWRMNPVFVKENAYDGVCGGQPISEASQNCAAKAAATYMKAIVYGVFDGDVIYSAVAFGKSTADATAWKSSLPANRVDVWNTVKTAPEREQLVRFFAAGIVADNPQKFGLKRDQPISTLYP